MSPVVLLEMEVLCEIGRIRAPVADVVELLKEDYGVLEAAGDFRAVVEQARALGWTRDLFDRLIVAHALSSGALLLTADDTIRKHCTQARWD